MTWWHYLLLSNLYLILFFGFYMLLLKRETFFQLNRVYLVGAAVMSFLIPVIQLDVVKQWFITQKVQETIYSASPAVIYHLKAVQPPQVTIGEVLSMIYLAGICVLSLKLIWQLFTLSRFIRTPQQVAAAWSFFKKIKVDEKLHNSRVITAHEEVHARQWHSADVLLIEVIMIFNWFNPFVYLYRKAVKQTHEFIADRDAVKAGASKAEYAMLLLSQTFDAPVHHLLNPFFNGSELRQRILMLHKNKSHYSALLKYGFSAPLFVLMLALSSATINNSIMVKNISQQAAHIFEETVPAIINDSTASIKPDIYKPALNQTSEQQHGFTSTPSQGSAIIQGGVIKDTVTSEEPTEVFTEVDKLPEFAGGTDGLYRFLSQNIHYPAEAIQQNAQGRSNITFIVEKDGSLSDIKALNNPGPGLSEEAVRVILALPRWIPGEQDGHPVRVRYTMPVAFKLPDADTVKSKVITHIVFKRRTPATQQSTADSTTVTMPNKVTIFNYQLAGKAPATVPPLLIIDGKEAPAGTSLTSLDVKKISSISVLKDETAIKAYGPKYEKGLLVITTKQ